MPGLDVPGIRDPADERAGVRLNTIMHRAITHLQHAQPLTHRPTTCMAYCPDVPAGSAAASRTPCDAAERHCPLGGRRPGRHHPVPSNRQRDRRAAGLHRATPRTAMDGVSDRDFLPGLSVRRFPVHDASEPLLPKNLILVEFLRVRILSEMDDALLHRLLHHAPEEKPRRGGAAAGQGRPGLRRSVLRC